MKGINITATLLGMLMLSLLMLGCNNGAETSAESAENSETLSSENVIKNSLVSKVDQTVNDAISSQDYRLYAMTGRRVVLPGFESKSIEEIKKRCGIKLLSGTGDVLKNSQDRSNRRLNYQFALKVNQKIYPLCLENHSK